jgi:hypothetical protein
MSGKVVAGGKERRNSHEKQPAILVHLESEKVRREKKTATVRGGMTR